jgi:hypothetical protein
MAVGLSIVEHLHCVPFLIWPFLHVAVIHLQIDGQRIATPPGLMYT